MIGRWGKKGNIALTEIIKLWIRTYQSWPLVSNFLDHRPLSTLWISHRALCALIINCVIKARWFHRPAADASPQLCDHQQFTDQSLPVTQILLQSTVTRISWQKKITFLKVSTEISSPSPFFKTSPVFWSLSEQPLLINRSDLCTGAGRSFAEFYPKYLCWNVQGNFLFVLC